MTERILSAASWGPGQKGQKPKLYIGKTHERINRIMFGRTGYCAHPRDEGFITTKNRFVDRITAAQIAKVAKQIPDSGLFFNLIAEDLH